MRIPRRVRSIIIAASIAHVSTSHAVGAQQVNEVFNEPSVFDLTLGDHARELDVAQFAEFACGTNGGPPSLPLRGFHEFDQCRADAATGLHEVYFRYDDQDEFIARARDQWYQTAVFGGTTAYAFPVIVSALFDDAGILQGIRIVSDPRIAESEREIAFGLSQFLANRYGLDADNCDNLPMREGETAVGGTYIRQQCQTVLEDGTEILLQTEHYRRPGEVPIDRRGDFTQDEFWSSSNLLVLRETDPVADAATAEAAMDLPEPTAALDALIASAMDCAGCDFAGDNFRRGNLSNANLQGADLSGANFHNASLAGADLRGADLSGANLNRADLRRANLEGANLEGAMGYAARLEGASLVGANLANTLMATAQFTRADLTDASLFYADIRTTRFADAILVGADLTQVYLEDGVLLRADLTDATLDGSILINAVLREALLVRATFLDADLYGADLRDTDLTDADLRRTRLTNVFFRGAITEGTLFD